MSFIVFHSQSGAMDGVYSDERAGLRMLEHWRKQVPGDWLLLKVMAGESKYVIPDHIFAADRLSTGTFQPGHTRPAAQ